jgi:diacylglycerol kinase family enzyme
VSGTAHTVAPERPLVLHDRSSRGSRTARAWLAAEAQHRDLKLVELGSCEHFAEADRATAEHGADALALSGGDESQSAGAVVACGRELPYACIPTGTDNLFARDLGVDVDDAIGALDALVDYCEYYVDVAEVNGLAFVNYAALGLACRPVRQEHDRRAGPRSAASLRSYVVAYRPLASPLRWFAASGRETAAALFVSNNCYRLHALEIGGRARLDGGVLGIGTLDASASGGGGIGEGCWRELHAPTFEVDSAAPVLAEIDGRVLSLDPPLRFRSLPRALRVRIPVSR